MTPAERIERLLTDGSPITPADFPPQHDGKRFQVRRSGNEWQVYGVGVLHVCMCSDVRLANMVADALEAAADQNGSCESGSACDPTSGAACGVKAGSA